MRQIIKIFIVESSIGMPNFRVSDVGRRLITSSTIDEKELPSASKPGFSFGITTRSKPEEYEYCKVKLWPKCSYEPIKHKASRSATQFTKLI